MSTMTINSNTGVLELSDRQQELTAEINEAWKQADGHARQAVYYYVEAGQLLLEMRGMLPGDLEFGQWRKQYCRVSSGWARKLMVLARTYTMETVPVELPVSTLIEMAQAPVEVRVAAEVQAADPDQPNPSVRDVKKAAKEARSPDASPASLEADPLCVPDTAPDSASESLPGAPEPMPRAMRERLERETVVATTPVDYYQSVIDRPAGARESWWGNLPEGDRNLEAAFALLGLPPFFEGKPDLDTIAIIVSTLRGGAKPNASPYDVAYNLIKAFVKAA